MPEIETARLRLRPFTLDDLDDYYTAIRSDPDVMRFLPGGQPQPRERAEQVIRFFIDY
jgi:RimJ/RimL family protein N-acetyltransferase